MARVGGEVGRDRDQGDSLSGTSGGRGRERP